MKFLLEEENQVLLDSLNFDELYHRFPRTSYFLTGVLVDDLGVDLKLITDNLTTIPDYFCNHRKDLATLDLGSSVTSIGNYAFSGCTSLTSVAVPDSVTFISREAFLLRASLTTILYGGTVTQFTEQVKKGPEWHSSRVTVHCIDGDLIYGYR